jgi:hypothetical protein
MNALRTTLEKLVMARYEARALQYAEYPAEEMMRRAHDFYQQCNRRRSVRHFSSRPIPQEIIELLVRTAGAAPSGANKQPWTFVAVTDHNLKHEIRVTTQKEKKESYERRMLGEWLEDLEARDRLAQGVSIDSPVSDSSLPPGLWSQGEQGEKTLCDGVGWDSGRLSSHGCSQRWSCGVDPHSQPDGVLAEDSWEAEE